MKNETFLLELKPSSITVLSRFLRNNRKDTLSLNKLSSLSVNSAVAIKDPSVATQWEVRSHSSLKPRKVKSNASVLCI